MFALSPSNVLTRSSWPFSTAIECGLQDDAERPEGKDQGKRAANMETAPPMIARRNRENERIGALAALQPPADFACRLEVPKGISFVSPLPEPDVGDVESEPEDVGPAMVAQRHRELSSFSLLDMPDDGRVVFQQPMAAGLVFQPLSPLNDITRSSFSLLDMSDDKRVAPRQTMTAGRACQLPSPSNEIARAGDAEAEHATGSVNHSEEQLVVSPAAAARVQRSAPPTAHLVQPSLNQVAAVQIEGLRKRDVAWEFYRRNGKVMLLARLQLQRPPEVLLARIADLMPPHKAEHMLREPESSVSPFSAASEKPLSICCRDNPICVQFVNCGLGGRFLWDPLAWQCCNTARQSGWQHFDRYACVLCKHRAGEAAVAQSAVATPVETREPAGTPQRRSLFLTRPEHHKSMRV